MKMSCHALKTGLVLAGFSLAASVAFGQDADLPLIDTHAHLNFVNMGKRQSTMDFPAGVDGALARMERFGFRRTILMPQPSPPDTNNAWELQKLDFAVKQFPEQISRGGGGGTLNPMIQATAPEAVDESVRAKFRAAADAVLASKPVVLGEVTAHHVSMKAMGPQHGYESVPADHPLLLMLVDIAAQADLPVDFHFDLVPEDMERPDLPIFNDKTPMSLEGNLASFERLLAHNPKAIVIWAHAGTDPLRTRNIEIQRRLLRKYPNLMMSLRLAGKGNVSPVIALDSDTRFKPVWVELFKEFPDRFVLGSDYFHGPLNAPGRGPEEAALSNYQTALKKLPREVGEALAYRNAMRIFKLPSPQ
jgi:predicted TIM-barrel fold metal-dependent hydrolase